MIILRSNPSPEDTEWDFTVDYSKLNRRSRPGFGIIVSFSHEAIKLEVNAFPQNRILQNDDPQQFILMSIANFRFPDQFPSVTTDYVNRVFKAGFFLNKVQYRFYHHSNSQLRGRSCLLRVAKTDEELDARIYQLGEFGKIMNIAKRAKRIGLLFSGAEVDYQLSPDLTADIPDIKCGDELFSDGCGLAARKLLISLSKAKRIVFRGDRYTPSVIQIRYRGYKGVLMLHPPLDVERKHMVHFRDSMKKFKTTIDVTFSVVDYSSPYKFGRLNNDVVVLLASLGISNEKLLAKQDQYFNWITEASSNVTSAIDFLSCLDNTQSLVERVLLDGLDSPEVSAKIHSLQRMEVASFRKNGKMRVRMLIHKSRLLFGVCDPFGVLNEGEVHVRVMVGRQSATTLTQTDVLVVRNPCLHPGDCLKLRAVQHSQLQHLVDCVVFSTKGARAAPSMSSGGDLDGDKFFVCWDPDLVPSRVAESYTYPPNREHISNNITRADLANHFAAYNNAGVAKVAALHQKWARSSVEGAMCSQCQELNALHSQSVDGARIKIPERLLTPPESEDPYVIDVLGSRAAAFETEFSQRMVIRRAPGLNVDAARALVVLLLRSEQNALSEYELFNQARAIARAYRLDISRYLPHINVAALSTTEKYELSSQLDLMSHKCQLDIWNSLFRSDIIPSHALESRDLGGPLKLQRLYSSRVQGLASFFEYLEQATQEFSRKLIIIKTDSRFSIGIFIRGIFPWDEDPVVNEDVVICPFLNSTSGAPSTYRSCTKGYRLHCSYGNFQLFNVKRADTFVFITRPPAMSGIDIAASIALQKISSHVQKQIGRINRTPVTAVEIHVLSNRDRIGHQNFDLRFDHVQTEEYLRRFNRKPEPYIRNDRALLSEEEWDNWKPFIRELFKSSKEDAKAIIKTKGAEELCEIIDFAFTCHEEEIIFSAFNELISIANFDRNLIERAMEKYPPLVYAFLKAYPPLVDESRAIIYPLAHHIVRNLIRGADTFGIAALVALERVSNVISSLSLEEYVDLLNLASLCVRSRNRDENEWLGREVMLVMDECRNMNVEHSDVLKYVHKHSLAVLLDQMEESADECPCDEKGRIARQRQPPTSAKLLSVKGSVNQVLAHVRVDAPNPIRLHTHVRLQAASLPGKGPWIERAVVDGIVTRSGKGELNIELLYPLPPEYSRMDWNIYTAGNTATTKAMLDALLRLGKEGRGCCAFYDTITEEGHNEDAPSSIEDATEEGDTIIEHSNLNPSQMTAVGLSRWPLTLIWGPPGTGKTTVIVEILRKFILGRSSDSKILMAASTHNAVDNVLERFIRVSKEQNLLEDEQILRVATDASKVNKALQSYTIDARVGGDMHQNERLKKKAEDRVNRAIIVFTTCAGAGLGTLRSTDFDTVLIDEASQVSEPCALIPLVKGCRRAVLVGDHVQLRPMVRTMGETMQLDVSLMERLYTKSADAIDGVRRTMLDTQYRFPEGLARFPSEEFYNGNLKTGITDGELRLQRLLSTQFPWTSAGSQEICPTIFVQCSSEEDMGGSSKGNRGQVALVAHIERLLRVPEENQQFEITVLSPYTKQIRELKNTLPAQVTCSTIDSFQGRESDIIIFSTVRCNAALDIGFVKDERRLNVAWTRAKVALIIVGDRGTLSEASPLWRRAIQSCRQVTIDIPESSQSN